jgi:hypothetical protein
MLHINDNRSPLRVQKNGIANICPLGTPNKEQMKNRVRSEMALNMSIYWRI